VHVDVLLETFGTTWAEVRDGAVAAERAGFDGVWLNDHLAGSVQGAPQVLECWTVLSALAASVPRLTVGPLVLNVANRDPGTLAVMAATLQQVSGGRLVLGLGAGARAGTAWAVEQEALGRRIPSDAGRRQNVETAVVTLHRIWSGEVPPAAGFLRPEPVPPIVIAAFGPKMAALAGRVGDGICVPVGPATEKLVAVARGACSRAGRDPGGFLVVALLSAWSPRGPLAVGTIADRLVAYVAPPFGEALGRLGEAVTGWRTEAASRSSAPTAGPKAGGQSG
jgi:alkanesulfonate monooxygenase SsuD/methylene tetrahydromethanopterin reductase-like flavin-dependent oxidoreductase (luciferase family)